MTPLHAKSVARSRIARRASVHVSDGQGCSGPRTPCAVQAGASIGDAAITPTRTVRSRSTELLEDIAELSNMFLECGVCHRAIPHPGVLERCLRSNGVLAGELECAAAACVEPSARPARLPRPISVTGVRDAESHDLQPSPLSRLRLPSTRSPPPYACHPPSAGIRVRAVSREGRPRRKTRTCRADLDA